MADNCPFVPVQMSPGDVLDRIAILRIKRRRFSDDAIYLRVIESQLRSLEQSCERWVPASAVLAQLVTELTVVNEELWSAEDRVRQCRALADRDGFVECSEAILRLNDRRCLIKGSINRLLGAIYIEEKNYRSVASPTGS